MRHHAGSPSPSATAMAPGMPSSSGMVHMHSASGTSSSSPGGGGRPGETPDRSAATVPAAQTVSVAWAEFLHLPGKRFTNFDLVREEIVRETNRVAPRRQLSPEPIRLTISSPNVLDLTIVDLPGITKVPVGDQPRDIEARVKEMILEYIAPPTAIILAITEATSDIANSEALKLARQVDKTGSRTIGVLTKLDLMDAGTDAVDVLLNRVIPLSLGFVGVVNRSQKDINEGRPMSDARRGEALFFQRHPAYRGMAARMGSPYLATMLNALLMKHAKEHLPKLKLRITTMMSELQHEMSTLGEPVAGHDRLVKGELLLMLLSKYATAFTSSVDGTSDSVVAGDRGRELAGGARVAYVFNDVFASTVNSIDPFDADGLTDSQIVTAIHNAGGTRPPLFVPQGAFELLVKAQIRRLEEPAMHCVDLVYDELVHIAADCESPELRRFHALREAVLEVVHGLLRKTLTPTHTMVSNLVHIELAHINTSHPDFIGGSRAVAELLQTLDSGSGGFSTTVGASAPQASHLPGDIATALLGGAAEEAGAFAAPAPSVASEHSFSSGGSLGLGPLMPSSVDGDVPDRCGSGSGPSHRVGSRMHGLPSTLPVPGSTSRDKMGCAIIKTLIRSYFNIVRKNILDLVPKTVMCFLVNCTKDNIRDELIRGLYREEEHYDELLRENDDAACRRATCAEMQTLLSSALDILHEVRDFVVA